MCVVLCLIHSFYVMRIIQCLKCQSEETVVYCFLDRSSIEEVLCFLFLYSLCLSGFPSELYLNFNLSTLNLELGLYLADQLDPRLQGILPLDPARRAHFAAVLTDEYRRVEFAQELSS